MKKNIFTFLLLLSSFLVSGQEFIKEVGAKQEISLIREISAQTWLTYSYYSGAQSVFAKVTETGANAPILYLPKEYFVYDFEIYDDTAFFCGYNTATGTAIFGYFDCVAFAASTVYCCQVSGVLEMKKLVVFNDHNNPHVIFTGTLWEKTSIVGDIVRNSANSWVFYMASCREIDGICYDDVAVTETYIVATCRSLVLDSGYIHYFHKPVSYSTIFPYHFLYRTVDYSVISPILVTSCNDDYFATLCNDAPSSFVMSRYNSLNDDVSLESAVMDGLSRDVNFNEDSKNVEALVFSGDLKYGASLLLHYDNTLFGNATIPVHRYENETIHSIDYLTNHTDCFIASGNVTHDIEHDYLLRLYKYKYNEWYSCPKKMYIEAKKINNDEDYFFYNFTPMTTSEVAIPIECWDVATDVNTICIH